MKDSEAQNSKGYSWDQLRLFSSGNPLIERLGGDFFDELPPTPGVYKMYGKAGHILYVGKAKDLRSRLLTYRNARTGKVSRKVARLVGMIHAIDIEELESEEAALLRENELIREMRPPFNMAKKQPEAYYFIGLSKNDECWKFRLGMQNSMEKGERLYGAFKGHGRVRRSLGALLRQLYGYFNPVKTPFDYPSVLMRRLTPRHYSLQSTKLSADETNVILTEVRRFLKGTGRTLLDRLADVAMEQPAALDRIALQDLEQLNTFYEKCTRHHYRMYKELGLDSPLIPQNRLDDVLVQYAFLSEKE